MPTKRAVNWEKLGSDPPPADVLDNVVSVQYQAADTSPYSKMPSRQEIEERMWPRRRQTFYTSEEVDIPPSVAKWALRLALIGLIPILAIAASGVSSLIGKRKKKKQTEENQ